MTKKSMFWISVIVLPLLFIIDKAFEPVEKASFPPSTPKVSATPYTFEPGDKVLLMPANYQKEFVTRFPFLDTPDRVFLNTETGQVLVVLRQDEIVVRDEGVTPPQFTIAPVKGELRLPIATTLPPK